MNAIIRALLVTVCLIGIQSCSKFSRNTPKTDTAESKVVTSGVSRRAKFESQEKGEVYSTRAPRNQVYLFAFDNSSVKKKYLPSINAQAKYLLSHHGASILLAGHTDHKGSREYNVALGERRAKGVSELLKLKGVPKKQVRIVSYGKERPVAFGDDKEADRLNRRVEMTYEAIR